MRDDWESAALQTLGRSFQLRPNALQGKSVYEAIAPEFLKIVNKSGFLTPLFPNPTQALFERNYSAQNIVLKARQMGLTTWVVGRFFLKSVLVPGTRTVLCAHTQEAGEGIFQIAQRMWEHLPAELREGSARTRRSNRGLMLFDRIDSEIRVVSAADKDAGRGLTIQNLHCSETARWPRDAHALLGGLRAALVPGGECVIESTPNGSYGCFYEEWMHAQENGLTQHFFPWWMEPSYRSTPVLDTSLTDTERQMMHLYGLDLEQISFRRMLETTYRGLRTQEFVEDAVRCFRVSGDCVFDIATIDTALAHLSAPLELKRNGTLQLWLPAVEGRQYLIAVDPAGGGSDGDFAAIQVIDLETGMQCAELQQRIAVKELAHCVCELASIYQKALVVIERNNHGSGVLAHLEGKGLRLYEQQGQPGWLTHANNRSDMIGRLGALLEESPHLFRSERFWRECRSFIRGRGGRAEAASGTHDDCVMAMALGIAVRDMWKTGLLKNLP